MAATMANARWRDFARDYELGRLPELRDVERAVLGCDYGGTSWTTRREAEQISRWLRLRQGTRVLEVGAGAGWPGLFLARESGAEIVLADVPLTGLRIAAERAAADGTSAQCRCIAANGAALPFRDGCFDALTHSDVLCCTPAKQPLLAECRRVARAGARMVYSVIAPAAGLAASDRRVAIESGPPWVEVDEEYTALLEKSRWRLEKRIDVSGEYLDSLRVMVREMEAREGSLRRALGDEELDGRLQRRRVAIVAVERGLLRRDLYAAVAR